MKCSCWMNRLFWLFVVVMLLATPTWATWGRVWPVEPIFRPITYADSGGLITVEFTVRVHLLGGSTLEAVVGTGRGAQNRGIEKWSEDVVFPKTDQPFWIEEEKAPTFVDTLSVWVPLHDTSFITVTLTYKDMPWECEYYFITTQDTIEFWPGYPEKPYGDPADAPAVYEVPWWDTVPHPTMILPEGTHETPRDTTPRETASEKKQRLEQAPLVGQSVEYIYVDGQMMWRFEGDRYFQPTKPMTAEELIAFCQHRDDSLEALFGATDHDVVVRVQRASLLDTVKALAGQLTPLDSAGKYSVRVTGTVVGKLTSAGVAIILLDGKPYWTPAVDEDTAGHKKQPTTGDDPRYP
jgi:hypothetical protein